MNPMLRGALWVALCVAAAEPRDGMVSGAGWIGSPPGALGGRPDVVGRATFSFESRARPGDLPPAGGATFRFTAGDLHFTSSSYSWLVIAGNRATFKGRGTINGAGDYTLLVTAIDGDAGTVRTADRVRIRITDRSSERLIYDNHAEAPLESDAATPLGGGGIAITRDRDR